MKTSRFFFMVWLLGSGTLGPQQKTPGNGRIGRRAGAVDAGWGSVAIVASDLKPLSGFKYEVELGFTPSPMLRKSDYHFGHGKTNQISPSLSRQPA